MSNRICTIEGCERKHVAKGLCNMHYSRSRHGEPKVHKNPRVYGQNRRTDPIAILYCSIYGKCNNAGHSANKWYKEKKVNLCKAWLEYEIGLPKFKKQIEDLGPKPTPAHTIDRINNSLGYCCGQCEECAEKGWPMNLRWASKTEQAVNRDQQKNTKIYPGIRKTKAGYSARIKHKGKEKHLSSYKTLEEAIKVRKEAEKKRDFLIMCEGLALDIELLNG